MAGEAGGAGAGARQGRRWDVALSFAGAQRDYVRQVAEALKAQGIRCFYDADELVGLWGTHLAEELPRIYAQESAAVVVFVSADYAEADWARLELRAAFSRAVTEAGVYVLPARFDDSQLPSLLPDVVSVDLRRYAPEQFADLVVAKLAELAVSPPGGQRARAHRPPSGRPLEEVTDPFALEVHRPVQPEDMQPGLSELPAYVWREHDAELGSVVRAAAQGRSTIAVLVGGSSTGKTRACWEALGRLHDRPDKWRLWHPIDPARPDAALRELPGIGPRTVVWLNEAQFYLDAVDGLGERVAAGLRELLRDPARAPVLVLATLWPQFWDSLTARPVGGADPHAQARELLVGRDITVPVVFTKAQLQRLSQAGDPRLAQAGAAAQDGQVIQFLAGAPELLARYRNAPPAAAALVHAAMDARRLGMGIGLPLAFLAAAASGYLTDIDWDILDQDWLEQALAYTAVPCRGVGGPLTCIRPRPARSRATGPGSRNASQQPAGTRADIQGGPLYRLTDYLDQHGRHHRKDQVPPAGFWAAAADHAFPGDQAMLGYAAYDLGLYRDAAQLHKNAAACGDLEAISNLGRSPHYLDADIRPVLWAAAHVPLDAPYVATLLDSLQEAGAHEQVTALAGRAAVQAPIDNPYVVTRLMDSLRKAGAKRQVTALLHRDPAAQVPLDDPDGVARLLDSLQEAGAHEQVTALAGRAAAQAPLDNPGAVARLLDTLRGPVAKRQMSALMSGYSAAYVSLDNRDAVARLLRRDPAAHVTLDDSLGVASLLDSLRGAGAHEQVTALAERAAAHFPLDDPGSVASLLARLRARGAATALAGRAAAQVPLDNPGAVASLLDTLRRTAPKRQVTVLLRRNPAAHVTLDDSLGVARLLDILREVGAKRQVTVLLRRDPATHFPLDDLFWAYGVLAALLDSLRKAGAHVQATALAERAIAHVPINDPAAVAILLHDLRQAGAQEQVTTLLLRDPAAHATLENPAAVARLLDSLREAGAQEQVTALLLRDPAAHATLGHRGAAAALLDSLREAGAQEQVTALIDRLAGAGMFVLIEEEEGREDWFRYGRQANGTLAEPWGWEDLD